MSIITAEDLTMYGGVVVGANTVQRNIDSWVNPQMIAQIKPILGRDLYNALIDGLALPVVPARITALWEYVKPMACAYAVKFALLNGAIELGTLGVSNPLSQLSEQADKGKRMAGATYSDNLIDSYYAQLLEFLRENATDYPERNTSQTVTPPQSFGLIKADTLTTNY